MSLTGRSRIWLAVLLLVCGQGCRSTDPYSVPQSATSMNGTTEIQLPTVDLSSQYESIVPACHSVESDTLSTPVSESDDTLSTPVSESDNSAAEYLPPAANVIAMPDERDVLKLDDVVQSVLDGFPLLRAEFAERQIADGRNVSAWGPYDLNLGMYSVAEPMGYYKNYRSGVSLKQAVYRGGYIYGGYRIGRDDIEPWYKERLTNEGGEFKLGAGVPLLQGRRIDKYRAEIMTSEVGRSAVEPAIEAELLQFVLAASDAYWSWFAAGKLLDAQTDYLRLATTRVQQIEERVKAGDLRRIALIDNQRLIASRETKLIQAKRKLQAAAIKLSLFFRDERGEPSVANSHQLPAQFPLLQPFDMDWLPGDIEQAWASRPELRYLDLQVQQLEIELTAAENMLLPRIDARLETSKDVGARAGSKIVDKTPFELEAGIWGEVPFQRRQACGKIQSLRGKVSQLSAKRQYSRDKVAAEVQDAASALEAARGRIGQARTTVGLARQSLDLGRQGFESGDLTVVTLNLYEQAVLDAEVQLIAAQADYFKAWAAYQASVGTDVLQP